MELRDYPKITLIYHAWNGLFKIIDVIYGSKESILYNDLISDISDSFFKKLYSVLSLLEINADFLNNMTVENAFEYEQQVMEIWKIFKQKFQKEVHDIENCNIKIPYILSDDFN